MTASFIGWGAAGLLVLTIGAQTLEQYRSDSTAGVSPWLFVGQVAASTGFLIYAALLGDPVFVSTNVLLIGSALTGLALYRRNRRRERRAEGR
ncbi:MAG TPA: hypothetical protein RMH99_18065 [Sandaracinaceae bacterium LLY-WYZ-13_1]|nr:hypothetical protein [Sandaracinaceae bacterium LLY-WYZ-13_1]